MQINFLHSLDQLAIFFTSLIPSITLCSDEVAHIVQIMFFLEERRNMEEGG